MTEPQRRDRPFCDVCARNGDDVALIRALVPDSSAVHGDGGAPDGERQIIACGQEHLQQLLETYARRPFVDEELWTGKIRRAVAASSGRPLHSPELATLTGLTVDQVARALVWHNSRLRRRPLRSAFDSDTGGDQ
jgi:hypothetical protein